MKAVINWLRCLVLAVFVAGATASASAAMTIGSEWSALGNADEGFLSRMIPGHYFDRLMPVLDRTMPIQDFEKSKPATIGMYSAMGYGYTQASVNGFVDRMLAFTGNPTGVGGFFAPGTVLTLTFTGSSVQDPLQVMVGSSGFFGFTTDVDAAVLSISSLTFSAASPPSRLIAGLDIVPIPETTTLLTGALLLLPFAMRSVRRFQRNR